MFYILIIIAVFFTYIAWLQEKNLVNPVSLFNLSWLFSLLLAKWNPYGLYEVHDATYLYSLVGLFCFDIFSFFTLYLYKNQKSIIKNNDFKDFSINIKPIITYQWFLILFLSVPFSKALTYFLNGGWMGIRTINSEGDFEKLIFTSTPMVMLYRNLLVHPGIIATITLLSTLVFLDKIKLKQLFPSLILIVMTVILSSGRMIIYRYILIFYLSFLTVRTLTKKKMEKKTLRMIAFFIVIALIAIISITDERSISDSGNTIERTIQTIIIYFSGSIFYFDQILFNPANFDVGTTLEFGKIFFGGIIDFFATFLSFFFDIKIDTSIEATSIIGIAHSIGPNIMYNAFPTVYYFFAKDFGFIFGFLELSIVSVIVSEIYIKMKKSHSIFWASLYIIIAYLVVNLVLWWDLLRLEFWFGIIQLILLLNITAKRKSKKKKFESDEV